MCGGFILCLDTVRLYREEVGYLLRKKSTGIY